MLFFFLLTIFSSFLRYPFNCPHSCCSAVLLSCCLVLQNMAQRWPKAVEADMRGHLGRYEIQGNDALKPMKFTSGYVRYVTLCLRAQSIFNILFQSSFLISFQILSFSLPSFLPSCLPLYITLCSTLLSNITSIISIFLLRNTFQFIFIRFQRSEVEGSIRLSDIRETARSDIR